MRSFLRIISIILLVAWMGTIFFFSHQPAEESTQTSGSVIEIIAEKFYPDYEDLSQAEKEKLIADYQFIVRKGTHVAAFAVLGCLCFLAFVTYVKLRFFIRVFCAIYLGAAYAAADEYHQSFITGRSCEFRDFLLDFAGVFGAILICTLLVKIIAPWRRKTAYVAAADKPDTLSLNETVESADFASYSPRVNIEPIFEETQDARENSNDELDIYSESVAEELTDETDAEKPAEESEPCTPEMQEQTEEINILEPAPVELEISEDEADLIETTAPIVEKVEVLEDKVEQPEVLEPVIEEEPVITEKSKEEFIATGEGFVVKKPKFEMSKEMTYAASKIGAAVVAVTKLCNKLTMDEQDSTRKELVNLALGRTEVLKAEILRITNLQIPFDEKKNLIEKETQEAYDYFDSIKAQIS